MKNKTRAQSATPSKKPNTQNEKAAEVAKKPKKVVAYKPDRLSSDATLALARHVVRLIDQLNLHLLSAKKRTMWSDVFECFGGLEKRFYDSLSLIKQK